MSNGSSLYLWAIVPPVPCEGQIDSMRQEFAINFNSREAIKRPVHLTLFHPFKADEPITAAQTDLFRKYIGQQTPFELELKNFGFFDVARVVFIAAVANPSLKKINTNISSMSRKIFELDELKNDPFHPHFTIGFRDLTAEVFPAVKSAYNKRPFAAIFPVIDICLFRHNGVKWVPEYIFPLGINDMAQAGLW